MKILEELIEKYKSHPSVIRLVNKTYRDNEQLARLSIEGLSGSQIAFVLAACYQSNRQNYIYIAQNKESAAYLQNTLDSLLEKKEIYFFPDSFRSPKQFEKLNSDNIIQRTRTISKLSAPKSKGEIIITYPEAIFEKVISPQSIDKQRLEIVKGEEVDLGTLVEILVEYDFTREEFVYEPGQFSVRGRIIDIFSYGDEFPYRIELFDNEVEQIRTFDPATQLSIKNIAEIAIIPNINTKFVGNEKVSLFEVAKHKGGVVFIEDTALLIEVLQNCFEKAIEFGSTIATLGNAELVEIFKDRSFVKPNEIIANIAYFHMVGMKDNAEFIPVQEKIAFNGVAQPNFNRNFKLLTEQLAKNKQAGVTNYLFTENALQAERFYNIFEDIKADVQLQPVLNFLHKGFLDHDLKIACYTDHEIFQRHHHYKVKQGFSKDKALNLRFLRELQPGDYVTHIDHGVGQYSGLEKININGHVQEAVRLFYKDKDMLYVSIHSLHKISKYVGKDGTVPKLAKLGSDAWNNLKRKTKKKVKDMAGELIKLYAQRKAAKGFAFAPDGYLQNELEASFDYVDTPDQYKASEAVKQDMMKAYPMDRLICGDVGFGKTEVAIRAAFKAVTGGKQVAILVPTTILAFQHYRTFHSRLEEFGVTVDYINRFRTTKEKNDVFKRLEDGKVEVVIGTHAILSKNIKFKDLGLLIIDEEQKFGVAAKEKLRNLKVNVDTLTLTATPIPRTLQFSLMAARDLSVMRTPPPNRQPIYTEVRMFNDELVRDAIEYEINRGGQVFLVHNKVKSLPDMVGMIRKLCPNADVAMAHGQMENKELEETLLKFMDKQFDVLVCTNIIETGIDIPNANTMIINNAHQFGLSDLHQLRGRVGRSNKQAYCYLFSPPLSTLTGDARKRLTTLEEFSDLGSGFDIAMRDLDIRGAGNLLGAEQSGFISDIGYEMYQKILEEAIQELKENEFKDLFREEIEQEDYRYVKDVVLDTDVEMHLPDDYVNSIQERLNLYTQMDKIETEAEIEQFSEMLKDRFGKIPQPVLELFEGLRLRWICRKLGFERLVLKNRKLSCYFLENPQSLFYESDYFQQFFQFLGTKGTAYQLQLKKSTKHLIVIKEGVKNLEKARELLGSIQKEVEKKIPVML